MRRFSDFELLKNANSHFLSDVGIAAPRLFHRRRRSGTDFWSVSLIKRRNTWRAGLTPPLQVLQVSWNKPTQVKSNIHSVQDIDYGYGWFIDWVQFLFVHIDDDDATWINNWWRDVFFHVKFFFWLFASPDFIDLLIFSLFLMLIFLLCRLKRRLKCLRKRWRRSVILWANDGAAVRLVTWSKQEVCSREQED